MKKLLKKLSEAHGASGYEDKVRKIVHEELGKHCNQVEVDKLGNVIGTLGSGDPRIMLAAHMDEIGFAVKYVDDNGFVWFVPMGGFYVPTIYSKRVQLHGDKGVVRGVIGSKPPHVMDSDEKKKMPKMKEMYVDVGAKSREEVEAMGVRIGTPITFDKSFRTLNNTVVTGKSMDDRAGCVALVEAAKRLKTTSFKGTVHLVATVQEEVGLKGARVCAYKLNPDVAIIIDVGLAGKSPSIEQNEIPSELGAGPVITYVEAKGRGLIANPKVNEWLLRTAKDNEIPYQLEVGGGGRTDAAAVYITGEGIPSGAIGVPCKYIHSPVEVVDLKDLENTVKLVVKAVERGAPVVWGPA